MADVRPDPSPTAPLGDAHSGDAQQIGQYTLIREIGRGGMGVVYEARQRNPRRVVAVKVLSRDLDNPIAVERFRREANVLARLAHPNIAVVFEADVANWRGTQVPFYAMEYISGGRTLDTYRREGGHSVRERLGLLIDLCAAVHHGHTRGVLHRDLKPANILIDADGRLKLIDFGVARVLADVDNPLRTSGDAVIGTLQYMSPEQISGDVHAIDAKSDLYSLGVIAWELLSGKLPYEIGNRTIVQAAHLIHTHEPPALNGGDAELNARLEPVLRKAMAKQRDDRYASVAEFAQDFRLIVAGLPASAPTRSTSQLSGSRPQRRWHRPLIVRLLVSVAIGCTCGFLAAHPRVLETPPGRSAQRWMSYLAMGNRDTPMGTRLMVVGVEDAPPISKVAAELGIEGIDDSNEGKRSLRRVYGPLVEKLAECRASVIALDLVFYGAAEEEDKPLVKGLQRAKELGVPVIAGMYRWNADVISPAVAEHVTQLGGVTGEANDDGGVWRHDLAVRPPAQQWMPSFALLAAVAKRDRGVHHVDVTITSDGEQIEVLFSQESPEVAGDRIWLEQSWLLPIDRLDAVPANEAETGLPRGSEVVQYPVDLPPESERVEAFLSAADALRLSKSELTRKLIGKVVVVCDFRKFGELRRKAPDGTMLPIAYTQIMAIDALLGTTPTRFVGPRLIAFGCLLSAALGAGVVMGTHRLSRLSRIVLLGTAVIVGIVTCLLLLLGGGLLLNPLPVLVAILIAALVSAAWHPTASLLQTHSVSKIKRQHSKEIP